MLVEFHGEFISDKHLSDITGVPRNTIRCRMTRGLKDDDLIKRALSKVECLKLATQSRWKPKSELDVLFGYLWFI